MIGAFIMGVMNNGMSILGIGIDYQQVIKGLVLLAAVCHRRLQPAQVVCIMAPSSTGPYRGVFPVAPTIFDDRGELDLEGQKRCIDFMIDAGSNGLCILANFSEQFVLTDDEREQC